MMVSRPLWANTRRSRFNFFRPLCIAAPIVDRLNARGSTCGVNEKKTPKLKQTEPYNISASIAAGKQMGHPEWSLVP